MMRTIASSWIMFSGAARASFSAAPPSVRNIVGASYFSSLRHLTVHQRATLPTSSLSLPRTVAFSASSNSIVKQYIGSRLFSHVGPRLERPRYRRFGQSEQPAGGRQDPGRGQHGPTWYSGQRAVWIVFGMGIGFYCLNLETVEMTGRTRFNVIPATVELQIGEQGYQTTLAQYKGRILPQSHPHTLMVYRVMERLIPQAPISGADWKIHVVQNDKEMNAFVLPGGKVFVFTGILPICQDEDGLAAVLGHEIAHVIAHHTAERISNSFVALIGVAAISLLFDMSGHLSMQLMQLLYSLPNSRTQEAEADKIGLTIMSKACFDPRAAEKFWKRMYTVEKYAPPQFMSTHPSSYNRMEAIREWLPQAERTYESSGCDVSNRYVQGFQDVYDKYTW